MPLRFSRSSNHSDTIFVQVNGRIAEVPGPFPIVMMILLSPGSRDVLEDVIRLILFTNCGCEQTGTDVEFNFNVDETLSTPHCSNSSKTSVPTRHE